MITISYCKTLEPTEWSSFHMWWVFFPLTSLFRKYFRSTAAAGRDAKCDSLFSSCMLVSCVLTHEGLPVNVFFFSSSVKGESLFFGWSFNSATGQFGWIFHAEIWNLAYAVLLSLKAQCPAIMWRHVWWSWYVDNRKKGNVERNLEHNTVEYFAIDLYVNQFVG